MARCLKATDGSYVFYCVGCGHYHRFNSGWDFNGDLENPTVRPSILVNKQGKYYNPAVPTCHLFITDGFIEYLADCTHTYAGQKVKMSVED